MLRNLLSRTSIVPCFIALLLGTLVVAAPIVNAKGRPPRTVFLILPDAVTPPTVNVQAEAIGGGHYHLYLETEAFMFTEVCVAEAEAVPIGHAHIHVNGKKVASAFFPVINIGPLDAGTHVIDVVLRGQDHRPIVGRDGLAQGLVHITVPVGPA
ncbi:hypothetical protein [uncultured Tateyamaria sp.]|uniref:hypothetical protein n=1 Tax=uncultured Tateyamaria sp. TaxID=455651 RepID=UPI0026077ABC|nr:hypothetical protein [uncultured Tateyamaria sp.]